MAPNYQKKIHHNASALTWKSGTKPDQSILKFHRSLPSFSPTPLVSLPALAEEFGVAAVLVKDETSRVGLPAFKILGASYATFRAVSNAVGLDWTTCSLADVAIAAKSKGLSLFAATDGNHGRAVARMASLLGGLTAKIYVPSFIGASQKQRIESEGAFVVDVDGDYDKATLEAFAAANATTGGILIQDNAFPGYEGEVPEWIVQGYSTMFQEADEQIEELLGKKVSVVIAPAGVGSLAHAAVNYYKGEGKENVCVATVEPDSAACVKHTLLNGKITTVQTGKTILEGMNCATPSTVAVPILSQGLDLALSVSDYEVHQAIRALQDEGVNAGPCGSAALAGLGFLALQKDHRVLNQNSVVMLLCTEAAREYDIPKDVRIGDPVLLTSTLVQIDSSNPDLSLSGGAGERDIVNFIHHWLAYRDIETHILQKTPGRPSIVGVIRGSGGGKSLMLNGHIDTVTNTGYKGDALSGHIKDGSVWGRGACDMKGGVAAAMVALDNARNEHLRGDVIFTGVADEENHSLGTQEVLDAGWRADGAIVAEPTSLNMVTYHKGFVHLAVTINGRAAHGSKPSLGIDSIVKAGYFLVELEKLQARYTNEGPKHPKLGSPSIHAGLIQGGEEPSSYPAKTIITVEKRTVPGETDATVEAELKSILDNLAKSVPDFAYELEIKFSRPPFAADENDPFIQTAFGSITKALGHEPTVAAETFWADSALLSEHGISTAMFGVSGGGLHAETEWATVESINSVTRALTDLAGSFCA